MYVCMYRCMVQMYGTDVCMDTPKVAWKGRQGDYISMSGAGQSGVAQGNGQASGRQCCRSDGRLSTKHSVIRHGLGLGRQSCSMRMDDGCMDVDVVIRGRVWARAALSGWWNGAGQARERRRRAGSHGMPGTWAWAAYRLPARVLCMCLCM